jgi:hypothetical protein
MLADLRIAQIAKKRVYSVEKDDPQPHVDLAFGFLMVNPPPVIVSTKSTSAFFRYWMLIGSTNSLMPWDSKSWSPVFFRSLPSHRRHSRLSAKVAVEKSVGIGCR